VNEEIGSGAGPKRCHNTAVEIETAWREEYLNRRDYAHLTEDQLCIRYTSLLENMVQFDDFGSPFLARTELPYWAKRLCWTEEEFGFRSLTERAAELRQGELSRTRPHLIAARNLWSSVVEPPEVGSYIVKFGQRQHVQEMLSRGRFRVAPATWYSDSSLNPAIRDDELTSQVFSPRGTRLSAKIEGKYEEISGIVGPLRLNRRSENFYVFCAAGGFDPRLFDDFQADACLVIRDLRQFGLALIRGFAAATGMTEVAQGSVHYLDPLHSGDVVHLVEMTKDFRYEYQKEWRISWRSEQPLPKDAAPVFVEIGQLFDCCEAYFL
jgi:hypothetical protein